MVHGEGAWTGDEESDFPGIKHNTPKYQPICRQNLI